MSNPSAINASAICSELMNKPLIDAAKSGDIALVENSLNSRQRHDKAIDIAVLQVFLAASVTGHLDLLKYVLEHADHSKFIDIDYNNGAALQYACRNNQLHIVEFLLNNYKTSPYFLKSKKLKTCFNIACENGHLEIVDFLLTTPKFYKYIVKDYFYFLNLLTNKLFKNPIYCPLDNGFIAACKNQRDEILSYLVYQHNISYSFKIKKETLQNKHLVEPLFKKREFYFDLNEKMNATSSADTKTKPVKI